MTYKVPSNPNLSMILQPQKEQHPSYRARLLQQPEPTTAAEPYQDLVLLMWLSCHSADGAWRFGAEGDDLEPCHAVTFGCGWA